MTPVRSKTGHIVHSTEDLRRTTCCNRKCDGWVVEDAEVTCRGKRATKEQQQ